MPSWWSDPSTDPLADDNCRVLSPDGLNRHNNPGREVGIVGGTKPSARARSGGADPREQHRLPPFQAAAYRFYYQTLC